MSDSQVDYEGTAAFDRPETKRPQQVWCPRCKRTIIDPTVERVCAECEAP